MRRMLDEYFPQTKSSHLFASLGILVSSEEILVF